MLALNDRIADGRDVSWIWDVDFEEALPAAAHVVATGTRAAGPGAARPLRGRSRLAIEICSRTWRARSTAAWSWRPGRHRLRPPTYTAMLELQRLVAARGLARPYWEARA